MYASIKNDLEQGLNKIKWFAGLLSERVGIELTVFKLLYQSEELRKKRDFLLKKIGEEVYHMNKTEKMSCKKLFRQMRIKPTLLNSAL